MHEVIKGTKNRDTLDYYATDPKCAQDIIKLEKLTGYSILEPCAGELHIAKELGKNNIVVTNDIVQRNEKLDYVGDFLETEIPFYFEVVVTNPPFKYFLEFLNKSFEYADKVIFFGRIQILEGQKRKEINEKHLTKVYVYSSRAKVSKGGLEEGFKQSSTMCFAWFVYEKNKTAKTTVEWI